MNATRATWMALSPIAQIGLIVLGMLLVASGAVWALRRRYPERDFSELASRTRSWWWMAAVFIGAVAANATLALVLFALLSFWALKEYVTLLRTRPADHRALFWAFLAIPIQYVWIARRAYVMFLIFIPVYMFLWLPVRLVLAGEIAGFVASASMIQWGLMAFVFGLSHLGYLSTLPSFPGTLADGRTLVLFLAFVTESSDVFQYVWGKLLGRHKILPTISPNKTWEGFLAGILSATLLSLLVRFLTPFSPGETLVAALLIAVAGFAGGAVMSAVKRDVGVKDFGALIPGHGGMLDRIDSLCYAAPVFFHYVRYFHS
ncbi:MAG TPA: phosphatidate cytidylyltransferase [bacterium]|nr:phosphatidate cytidylyltransferase [bacterium]